MSAVIAIGADHELHGFALAGVRVLPADGAAEVRDLWDALDDRIGLVILSSDAAEALESRLGRRADVLTVVMP